MGAGSATRGLVADPGGLADALRRGDAVFHDPSIVDDFPRTPAAKIEKYKLRADGPGATSWDREAHGWRVTRTGLSRVDAVAAGSPDPTAAR